MPVGFIKMHVGCIKMPIYMCVGKVTLLGMH
jgi:hypothetical protein